MRKKKKEVIPPLVEDIFLKEVNKFSSTNEWINLSKSIDSIYNILVDRGNYFSPKFNAVNWAFDVFSLLRQILFSFSWMISYAEFYKLNVNKDSKPSHVDFHVPYFADNCITRIYSCRDKLALMVWAFYCPFNPERREEILIYKEIIKRLKHPIKFGLKLKNQAEFLRNLVNLSGSDFNFIENYRHIKIHRNEPRIEIYGVKPHHGLGYMIPLEDQLEIERFKRELESAHPDPEFREIIFKSCFINGVLFERRDIRNHFFDYENTQKEIQSCFVKLLSAAESCVRIIRRRFPLRRSQ
jgi:hypothetical protein